MTNIAFITLIILVMAFPGYVLRASYFAGTFTRNVLPKSWTDDIARAILYSLPLHLVALLIFECLQHNGIIHTTLTFEIVYRILIGQYDNNLSEIANTLYHNKIHLGVYYTSVLLGAFAVGYTCRRIVWGYKLDVRWPWLLRYRNEWLYTLLGRDVPIPREFKGGNVYVRLEALTKIPSEEQDKTRLYRGFVEAFTTEENGTLRDIFLTDAERGKFKKVPAAPVEFYWKLVAPGNLLVLKYSELENMNITYLLKLPDSTTAPPS